jgi:mannitol-1-/sugar-/sorbitol-6-phosphatase
VILDCQAVLFDLDGVLVDSTPAVARIWTKWAMTHGLPPEKAIAHAHGRRSIETIRALAPQLNAAEENLQVERMEIEDRDGVVALAGSNRLLLSLPPDRFAIVTSATRALAKARLQYAGLLVPEKLVSADDVVQGKPSPEPYLTGAKLLGFPPRDCVVFEDTPAGIVAAQQAGMRVVALTNTYPIEELSSATVVVTSLAEISVEIGQGAVRVSTH